MEKPNAVQRAEIRALVAGRAKRAAGKAISQYEARLIFEANEREGTTEGAMIAYWAAGPDRPATSWGVIGRKPEFCGQCVMLDLKPLDSGVRYCRKRCTWQAREDEACDYGERAVDLEEALVRLEYAIRGWTWKIEPPDFDDDIPF